MILHLGWIGSDPPPSVVAAVKAVQAAAPASTVMFHTDETDVPAFRRQLMDSINLRSHMRSDVQRHAVLRRYGGLWLDADVRILRDPAEWASGWDRYTAIRLRRSPAMIGTDIIYVPPNWDGWDLVDAEIDRVLSKAAADGRVGVLALAHRMIDNCQKRRPDAFEILEPGGRWPHDHAAFTADAVVARGFDPPADPRPGLGDIVAGGLAAVGITKERVSRLVGRPCRCPERQAAMNRVGAKYLGMPPGNSH